MRQYMWVISFWDSMTLILYILNLSIFLHIFKLLFFFRVEMYSILWIYWIFLSIHLLMDNGVWFWLFSIVNIVAINVCTDYLYGREWTSLGLWPGRKSLGHMVVRFESFWGISKLISTMAILVCVPTNSECGFLPLHFLSNIYYQICWWQPFWGGLQNNFDAFLWWLRILNTWKHSYWPFVSLSFPPLLPLSVPLSLCPLSFIKKCLFSSLTSLLTGSFIPPEFWILASCPKCYQ